MEIRTATLADLDALAAVEARCFPPAEAASLQSILGRLQAYPNHFWLLWEGDELVSFVDGPVTRQANLEDWMYDDPCVHDEEGGWQMIFGVNTLPQYRRRGLAGQLLRRAIADAAAQGRRGLVLTCKPEKIPYYARFGFADEGLSPSHHGGALWHQMRLTLPSACVKAASL